MRAYVVQYSEGGIPEEPEVFLDKKKREDLWLDYVSRGFHLDPGKYDTHEKTIDNAMEAGYLIDPDDDSCEVHQWDVEISE